MSLKIKLPSEEMLPPVMRFNDVVGPLFAELKGRFPLDDEHTDAGLARSLGVFLDRCFVQASQRLEEIKPTSMTNEEWAIASEEAKHPHLHWQTNMKYLKQRRRYYVDLMGYRVHDRFRSKEEDWLEVL